MFSIWTNTPDSSTAETIKQLQDKVKELTAQLDLIQMIIKNYTNK